MIVSRRSVHDPASPLAGVKSTSRADSIIARLEAERAGADDAIYATPDGSLTEGTTANLFVVHGDELATPPLSEGILAGTMRTWLLGARRARWACGRWSGGSGATDVADADEALFTSSVAGAQPIVALDGTADRRSVAPGPLWRRDPRGARALDRRRVARAGVARGHGDPGGADRPHPPPRRGGRAGVGAIPCLGRCGRGCSFPTSCSSAAWGTWTAITSRGSWSASPSTSFVAAR